MSDMRIKLVFQDSSGRTGKQTLDLCDALVSDILALPDRNQVVHHLECQLDEKGGTVDFPGKTFNGHVIGDEDIIAQVQETFSQNGTVDIRPAGVKQDAKGKAFRIFNVVCGPANAVVNQTPSAESAPAPVAASPA